MAVAFESTPLMLAHREVPEGVEATMLVAVVADTMGAAVVTVVVVVDKEATVAKAAMEAVVRVATEVVARAATEVEATAAVATNNNSKAVVADMAVETTRS